MTHEFRFAFTLSFALSLQRIRTYNFPQDRVTDHRIQLTETGIESMMAGETLHSFCDALELAHIREQLDQLGGGVGSKS